MTAATQGFGAYRYEIQQRTETIGVRGQGAERRGGRNCGTYGVLRWKQRAERHRRAW
jgi:hypothetical protein